MKSQMTRLSGAFKEGTRAEEAAAMRSAPMRNGLKSKATGGALYEMQPVMSSAHLHRQARINGGESEEAPSQDNYDGNSQSSSSSGSSVVSLLGLLAFGAAAALAIIEHERFPKRWRCQGFARLRATQCDDEKNERRTSTCDLASQPIYLQRQR